MTAAEKWRADLASWAIPEEIRVQAPQDPWIHPVAQFIAPDVIPDSPAHQVARAALPEGGSVLDVGCGGGRAALALVPPASLLIGVDHQQEMLDAFEQAAAKREVASKVILGDWPDVADRTPDADVVVCHHVAYNVWELPDFVRALDAHARRRVVLELPVRHPLTWMNPLWKQFWNLDRPTSPTADDALTVIRDTGINAQLVEYDDVAQRIPLDPRAQAESACIRLCLPVSQADEVEAAVRAADAGMPRRLAAIWWDVAGR